MSTAIFRVLGLLAAIAIAAAGSAQGQKLLLGGRNYSLSPAKLVAGEVDYAVWSPDGADLAYITREDNQTQIGLFGMKRGRGGIVATLTPGERLVRVVWLNAGHKALLVTRSNIEGRAVATELLAVKVADGEHMTSRELWQAEYPEAEDASVAIQPSPSLPHALVTVHTAHGKTYLVLTMDAKAIVLSEDLAQAAKEGQEVAGWSSHGTAIFSPASNNLLSFTVKLSSSSADKATASGSTTNFLLKLAGDGSKAIIEFEAPSIPAGATVLECVPANGVLRQVRFPGFFQAAEPPSFPLLPNLRSFNAQLGQTSTAVQSLWLVPAEETKEPKQGLLVSAEADGEWICPSGRAIAFLCHRALFVRTIDSKNRGSD